MLFSWSRRVLLPATIKICFNLRTVQIKSKLLVVLLALLQAITQTCLLSYKSLGFSNVIIDAYQSAHTYIYFSKLQEIKDFTNGIIVYSLMQCFLIAMFILTIVAVYRAKQYSNSFPLTLSKIFFEVIYALQFPIIAFAAQRAKSYVLEPPYLLALPQILSVLVITGCLFIYQTLNFTVSFKERCVNSRSFSWYLPKKLLVLQVICVYSNIRGDSVGFVETIILSSLIVLLSLGDIYFFLTRLSFFYHFSRALYLISIVLPLAFNAITILQFVMSLFVDNNLATFFTLSFLIYLSIHRYQGYSKYNLLIENAQKIQDSSTAIQYIHELQKQLLQKFNGSSQQMVVAGIINSHILQCCKYECFCKAKQYQNKQTNKKSKGTNRRPYKQIEFLQKFTLQMVQVFQQKFPNSLSIFISILFLKLQYCNKYPIIFQQLQSFQHRNSVNRIEQQYMIYQLKMVLTRFIQQKNMNQRSLKTERILQLQQKQNQLCDILETITKKFISRWQIFNTGVCDLKKLEDSSKESLKVIRDINDLWNYLKKINSFTKTVYLKFLFYYAYILFLQDERQNIRKCISNIDAKIKSIQKIQITNFWILLFSSNVCTVQSTVNKQQIGKIKNITRNCSDIFGYERQKLLRKNINIFIPQSMSQQHNFILNRWVQLGQWKSINTIKDAICCSQNKNICFTTKLYLRVFAGQDSLSLIATILVRNKQDYIVISKQNKIEGYGTKFLEILGDSVYNKDFSQFSDIKGMYQSAETEPKRRTIVIKTESIEKTQNQTGKQNFLNKEALAIKAYKADVSFSSFTINRVKMLMIKLQSLSKPKIIQEQFEDEQIPVSEGKKNMLMAQRLSQMLFAKHNLTLDPNSSQNMQKSMDQGQESSSGILNYGQAMFGKQDQGNKIMEATSVSSSAQSFTYSLNKIITQVLIRVFDYSSVFDYHLCFTSIAVMVSSVVAIGIVWFQFSIYKSGLQNYYTLITFQDSNHRNLMNQKIIFNQVILLAQYNTDFNSFQYNQIVKRLQQKNEIFRQAVKQDLNQLGNAYSFSGHSLLQYLDKDVSFKHTLTKQIPLGFDASGNPFPSSFYQFNYFFYNQVFRVTALASQQPKGSKQQQIKKLAKIISDNWAILRKVSFEVIVENQELSTKEVGRVRIYLYAFISSYVLITLFIACFLYSFFNSKDQQRTNILMINRYISLSIIKKIKDYYISMQTMSPWKATQENSQVAIQPLVFDNQDNSGPKTQFIHYKSRLLLPVLFIIWLTINLPNSITSIQTFGLLQSIQVVQKESLQLQNSQNNLFAAYDDLKAKYLFGQQYKSEQQVTLSEILTDTRVDYVSYASKLNMVIGSYDKKFDADFTKILNEGICSVIENSVNKQILAQCESQKMKNEFIEKGVLASINNIQRTLAGAYMALREHSEAGILDRDNEIFAGIPFAAIDASLPFYNQVLNVMRKRIKTSLKTAMQQQVNTVQLLVIVNTIFNALMMVFWTFNIFYQLRRLSDLYGYILLIPPQFIKSNKLALKVIKSNLELET